MPIDSDGVKADRIKLRIEVLRKNVSAVFINASAACIAVNVKRDIPGLKLARANDALSNNYHVALRCEAGLNNVEGDHWIAGLGKSASTNHESYPIGASPTEIVQIRAVDSVFAYIVDDSPRVLP